MARPRPEDFPTRAAYRWRLKLWRRRHGGSLLAVLLIAFVFGGLSGSQTVLWGFVAFAVVAWMVARSRP